MSGTHTHKRLHVNIIVVHSLRGQSVGADVAELLHYIIKTFI